MNDLFVYESDDTVYPVLKKITEGVVLSDEEQQLINRWKEAFPGRARLLEELADPGSIRAAVAGLYAIEENMEPRLARFLQDAKPFLSEPAPASGKTVPASGKPAPLLAETIPVLHKPAPVPTGMTPIRVFKKNRFRYAAVLILLLGAGIYSWMQYTTHSKSGVSVSGLSSTNVQPGKEGAVLTLADGRQLVLDSLSAGVVALQGGARVIMNNGQLAYLPEGSVAGAMAVNTMTTPRGRQFQLVLPDGTKVWLNAASSLQYPTVFNGNERRVKVTGEAYFEVAQLATKPFIVEINDRTEIEVLGTGFNVNAYEDEAHITTTLLEGAIKILAGNNRNQPLSTVLKPGQQSVVPRTATISRIPVEPANTDQVMAWKNGFFNFEGKKLDEVMRHLSRWYDIEVIYEKGIPDIVFGGKMDRGLTLSNVLNILEVSKVHFRMEAGRRLIVEP